VNTMFAHAGMNASNIAVHLLGAVSPRIVNAVYPMEQLTRFHAANHISGLTGRWMDTGGTALGGAVRGPWHRMAFGHDLVGDGIKVLINPKLKFGHFLHHLGLDGLTTTGIPIPLIPKFVGEQLIKLGMDVRFVRELFTVNVPKILGGSLGLVCAGHDVLLAFSDAIPHTFMAAGAHFAFGVLNLGFGMFPPNFLLLSVSAAELGVGALTAYRAFVDPTIDWLGAPLSVFLPALQSSVLLSSIVAGAAALFGNRPLGEIPKSVVPAALAGCSATTAAFIAKAAGLISPFVGPLAGIATFLLARQAMLLLEPGDDRLGFTLSRCEFSPKSMTFALPAIPHESIGLLKETTFLLNEGAIRSTAATFIGNN
jgi:hypothetical protein